MKNLVLVGGGGHCRSVIDVIETTKEWNIIGILDVKENIGKKILGKYEIIGEDSLIPILANKNYYFLITVGQIKNNIIRKKLFYEVKKYTNNIATIISPYAYVSNYSKIGIGTIVMHHALVNVNVQIGENCIINSKTLIEHDCKIGNHCHISTGAILNGGVIVEDDTFFGSNSVAKQYITIEKKFINAFKFIRGNNE